MVAARLRRPKALALLPLYVQAPDVDVDALGNAVDMWLMRAQLHARQGRLHASVQALEQARPLAQQAATRAPADLQVLSRLATLAGRQAQALGGTGASCSTASSACAVVLAWRP